MPPLEVSVDNVISRGFGFQQRPPPLEVSVDYIISRGFGFSRDQDTMPPPEVSVDYVISGGFGFSRDQDTMPPPEASVDYVISGGFGFSRDQDTMPPPEVTFTATIECSLCRGGLQVEGEIISVDSLQQNYSTQGWIPCLRGQLTTKLLNPGVDPGFSEGVEGGGGGGAMVMHGRMLTARGECGRAECPRAKYGSFWPKYNLLLPMLVYLS